MLYWLGSRISLNFSNESQVREGQGSLSDGRLSTQVKFCHSYLCCRAPAESHYYL
jgi:hypothetical protein